MTAPVNPPINTLVFDVHGSNEAELHRLARERLAAFAFDTNAWVYGIDAHPEMSTANGSVQIWRGEVTALRMTTVP